MTHIFRHISALVMIILSIVLTGAFFYEYGYEQAPCPLCFLQRLMMIGVGFGMMLNVLYGTRIRHYDVAVLSAIVGGATSLRQILLHICPPDKPLGHPILGLSLYSWAFIVFASTLVGISFLLLFYTHEPQDEVKYPLNWFHWFAIVYFMGITLVNIISAYSVCGPLFC